MCLELQINSKCFFTTNLYRHFSFITHAFIYVYPCIYVGRIFLINYDFASLQVVLPWSSSLKRTVAIQNMRSNVCM